VGLLDGRQGGECRGCRSTVSRGWSPSCDRGRSQLPRFTTEALRDLAWRPAFSSHLIRRRRTATRTPTRTPCARRRASRCARRCACRRACRRARRCARRRARRCARRCARHALAGAPADAPAGAPADAPAGAPADAPADAHADALADAPAGAHGVRARPARVVDPNTARARPGSTGLTGARVVVPERAAGGPARGR